MLTLYQPKQQSVISSTSKLSELQFVALRPPDSRRINITQCVVNMVYEGVHFFLLIFQCGRMCHVCIMYIYICIYVCIMYIYICIYVCIMYIYLYLCMYYVYIYICIYVCVMYIYMYLCMYYVYIYLYLCM